MELQKTTGIVLLSAPIGERERRVVLLTKEHGKLSAFARGAMRPNSPLRAATMPFAFGDFFFYESRNSVTITGAEIKNSFPDLYTDLEGALYGYYFLELAEYYTREYNDEKLMLGLLYQSLKALTTPSLKRRLVKVIYEWKTLVINGEYPDYERDDLSDTVKYTLGFITFTGIRKLYTFTVSDEILCTLEKYVGSYLNKHLDRNMKSMEMLETVMKN